MAKQKSTGKSLLTAIPAGIKVRMVNCLEAENPEYHHDWVTASEPWEAGGNWLVLLEGFRGGFSLDKLELAGE
jgi:glycine cleavage system aminomethyltransferase T